MNFKLEKGRIYWTVLDNQNIVSCIYFENRENRHLFYINDEIKSFDAVFLSETDAREAIKSYLLDEVKYIRSELKKLDEKTYSLNMQLNKVVRKLENLNAT